MTHTRGVGYDDYQVPDEVDDPEAAALDLIVQRPLRELGRIIEQSTAWDPGPLRAALQQFASALELSGVFRSMTWHDARTVATLISSALLVPDLRPGRALMEHSTRAHTGADQIRWNDKRRASRALHEAAAIYPQAFPT